MPSFLSQAPTKPGFLCEAGWLADRFCEANGVLSFAKATNILTAA